MNLTKRQNDTLDFIKKYLAENGYPPTVREIAKALNISSPATIHTHLAKLCEKGLIAKKSEKNRALELKVDNEYLNQENAVVNLPLLGTVTAGSPIEAIENPHEFFPIPFAEITENKDFFALTVRGDSMIEIGIYDDDIVIVEKTEAVKNGDLVVAMTDEAEVTLKTFYREKDHIRLQPENKNYQAIKITSGKILGKAVKLYRNL